MFLRRLRSLQGLRFGVGFHAVSNEITDSRLALTHMRSSRQGRIYALAIKNLFAKDNYRSMPLYHGESQSVNS